MNDPSPRLPNRPHWRAWGDELTFQPWNYESPWWPGGIAIAAFAICAGLAAGNIGASIYREFGARPIWTRQQLFNFQAQILVCNFGALVVSFLMFLNWVGRVAGNIIPLGTKTARFTPTKAMLSFFIPLANLVLPYQALVEIWRYSDPGFVAVPLMNSPHAKESPILGAWWASVFFVLFSPLTLELYDFNSVAAHPGDRIVRNAFLPVSIAWFAHSLLAIALILGVNRRQSQRMERYRRLNRDIGS